MTNNEHDHEHDHSEPELLRCYGCKASKPPTEFHLKRTTKRGRDTWCRSCRSAYDRARGTRPGGPAKAHLTPGAKAKRKAAAASTKEAN